MLGDVSRIAYVLYHALIDRRCGEKKIADLEFSSLAELSISNLDTSANLRSRVIYTEFVRQWEEKVITERLVRPWEKQRTEKDIILAEFSQKKKVPNFINLQRRKQKYKVWLTLCNIFATELKTNANVVLCCITCSNGKVYLKQYFDFSSNANNSSCSRAR
jgi:hypothetical protein